MAPLLEWHVVVAAWEQLSATVEPPSMHLLASQLALYRCGVRVAAKRGNAVRDAMGGDGGGGVGGGGVGGGGSGAAFGG